MIGNRRHPFSWGLRLFTRPFLKLTIQSASVCMIFCIRSVHPNILFWNCSTTKSHVATNVLMCSLLEQLSRWTQQSRSIATGFASTAAPVSNAYGIPTAWLSVWDACARNTCGLVSVVSSGLGMEDPRAGLMSISSSPASSPHSRFCAPVLSSTYTSRIGGCVQTHFWFRLISRFRCLHRNESLRSLIRQPGDSSSNLKWIPLLQKVPMYLINFPNCVMSFCHENLDSWHLFFSQTLCLRTCGHLPDSNHVWLINEGSYNTNLPMLHFSMYDCIRHGDSEELSRYLSVSSTLRYSSQMLCAEMESLSCVWVSRNTSSRRLQAVKSVYEVATYEKTIFSILVTNRIVSNCPIDSK